VVHDTSMFLCSVHDCVPPLKDLQNYITPHYAARWRVIGTQLDLSRGLLDSIEYDHAHKAESCCNAVLEKWLDVDSSASWKKLFEVMESPAVSIKQGTSACAVCICCTDLCICCIVCMCVIVCVCCVCVPGGWAISDGIKYFL